MKQRLQTRKSKLLLFISIIIVVALAVGIGSRIYYLKEHGKINKWEKLEDGTYKLIVGSTHSYDYYEIPSHHLFKEVTEVEFYPNPSITFSKVYIPETIRKINDKGFFYDDSVITGGVNLEYIGEAAFMNAKEIPELRKVKHIGDCAFTNACIKDFYFSDVLEYIGEYAFFGSNLEKVDIPSSVKYIGMSAFYNTPWLNKQEGYVIVGDNILLSYPTEEEIIVPENVKSIRVRDDTTYDKELKKDISKFCDVRKIYIPDSVIDMDDYFNVWGGGEDDNIEVYIYKSSYTNEKITPSEREEKNIKSKEEKYTYVVEKGSDEEKFFKEKGYKNLRVVDKVERLDK